MGRTYNYPKDIFEQFDVELCDLERKMKQIQSSRKVFPVYSLQRLPVNIAQGEAFMTDTNQFCVRYEDKIYCMPGPSAVGIGPTVFAAQIESSVPWGSTASVWKLVLNDGSGSGEQILSGDNFANSLHCSSPVWTMDFQHIIYTQQGVQSQPDAGRAFNLSLVITSIDGSWSRTFIHDSGMVGIDAPVPYYYNYVMSPDGKKVALIDPHQNLYCVFADGSGDCGGGALSTNIYAGPIQWSPDSQIIYAQEYQYTGGTLAGINFDGSGSWNVIYNNNDFGFFYINSTGTRFATNNQGSTNFSIIEMNGTRTDYPTVPWQRTGSDIVNTFWDVDDSRVYLDRQASGVYHKYDLVGVNPDNINDYTIYHCPGAAFEGYDQNRGVFNWTLALVNGEKKVVANVFNEDDNGSVIVYWDMDGTGPHPLPGSESTWGDGGVGTRWDRYTIGGLTSCTGYFGTQTWDT